MVVSTRNTNRALCPQEISGPQKGIGLMNCHPCKKREQVDWQCKLCQLAFCVNKLQNMYHLQKDLETEDWTCPRCILHICRCSQCRIFYSKNNISLPEDEDEDEDGDGDGDKAEKKKLDDVELVRLRKENEGCKRKLEMTEQYVDILQGSIKDLRGQLQQVREDHEHQLQQVREDHEHQLQKLKDALDCHQREKEARIALEAKCSDSCLPLYFEDSVSERQEELSKEKEEQAKKKQSVQSNKDVALEETINATAADAQQQARAIALDEQQQLCKTSEALPVLASASYVSREREESLNLVNKEINLYHSMMDKEGNGEEDIMKAYKAAHEEIDGASSALINRDYDEKVTSEELDSATASKTPTGPTPSSSSVGSSMVITLENKPCDQHTVSSSILSSVSNSDMSLIGDYQNKYNYGDLSPEEEWRSGELKKIAEDLDDFLRKVKTGGSVAYDEILGFAKPLNDELTLDNISRATLSSLPDEVVGVMSLPSEDSVSERQEELSKEKEEQAKKTSESYHEELKLKRKHSRSREPERDKIRRSNPPSPWEHKQ